MFIGANDGFPIAGAPCCTGDWVTRYARRARTMMRSYARGGRTTVYWLLLPTPRDATFRRVFRGVNAAVRRAARRYPARSACSTFAEPSHRAGAFARRCDGAGAP